MATIFMLGDIAGMDSIKTERLELRPLELNHAEQLLPIWSDEEVGLV